MDVYVLDDSLVQIGIIDGVKSLIWANRYVDFGDCEVYIAANQHNLDLLQIGNFLVRNDDDMVCRIESVEINTNTEEGDYLIVTGSDIKKMLNQRIVWKQTSFKGQAGAFVTRLINENFIQAEGAREISNMRLGTFSGFTDALDIQTTYDYVGNKINDICKMFGYGSKLTIEGANFVFNLYRGTDRSYAQSENDFVVFSSEFENLISTKYKTDNSNFYSVALVAGEGEGNLRTRSSVELTNQTGLNRFELYVDADDISQNLAYDDLVELYPGGTISTVSGKVYYSVGGVNVATLDDASEPENAILLNGPYLELLDARAREKLAETGTIVSFEGEVESNYSYKYGVDYHLGDIVQVKNDYGIEASARIVEVIESFDDNGHSVIPTFEYVEVNN